jgi:hypothetical protein
MKLLFHASRETEQSIRTSRKLSCMDTGAGGRAHACVGTRWCVRGLILVIGLCACVAQPGYSMGYAQEPSTRWRLSGGIEIDGTVYFLSEYRLFQQPTGLRRFPDGGQSRTLTTKLELYRYTARESRLEAVAEFSHVEKPARDVLYSYFAYEEPWLTVVYRDGYSLADSGYSLVRASWRYHLGENVVEELPDYSPPAGSTSEAQITPAEIREMTQDIRLEEWGVPSPVDYCDKSVNAYRSDLVKIRGDYAYRSAVVEHLVRLGRQDALRRALNEIAQRKESLSGYKADYYDMIVSVTEQDIRNGLQ